MSKESPKFNIPLEINQFQLFLSESLVKEMLGSNLSTILDQSDSIQRFTNLDLSPDIIRGETVKIHTLKMYALTYYFPCDKESIDKIRLTVAIHDLPETRQLIGSGKNADTTAPAKEESNTLDQHIKMSEEQVAREIFNNDDKKLQLYLDFSQAGEFLKGKSDNLPTKVGLISEVLDKIEAALTYYRLAIATLKNGQEPKTSGLTHGFNIYNKFSKKLDSLKDTSLSDTAILCQKLLDESISTVKKRWEEMPPDKIPPVVQECLANLHIQSQN